ncbi:MAG: TatD family hydrolase [Roseivirga sp.]
MIETHAHIYLEQFKEDLADTIRRAQEAGVKRIYMPNIDHTSIDDMMEVEATYPGYCVATMGLHPCSVGKDFEKELYRVEAWLGKRDFVAIGEMGTDLYWDKTYVGQQVEAFKIQAQWAKELGKPIIIHCRESLEMTIELAEELKDERLTGVFHCFGGTPEQAKRIKELDFFIGLGGVTTFKNSGMDKVIPDLDLSHVVLETDSPYLSPVPHRGKRNEPAYLSLIAQRIADLKEMRLTELKETTTNNAKRLFKVTADDLTG